METLREERVTAIHLLRVGHSVAAVAQELDRSCRWVRKWRSRYETEGWSGLESRSKAPKRHGTRTPDVVRQAIARARSQLEAEAALGDGLKYIGGRAVRTKLRQWQVEPMPSVPTIERVLREFNMTRPQRSPQQVSIDYPALQPTAPHQLCQVDIVPHRLTGGESVAGFNGLDVVSRYPTGQPYARQRSEDAARFLIHFWQTVGIPCYTQVDNEGCFSGGHTHPHVLGKVVRLALLVGTELLFSPVRHPESNGSVERFHQDYNRHVWEDTYLADRNAVGQQTDHFMSLYRQSRHHAALRERTPDEVHHETDPRLLDLSFELPEGKLPLTEGRIHFIRRVRANGTVSVLNVEWIVPDPDPLKGVWVTIELRPGAATLSIYDAAPDVLHRACLASYPFPLTEEVLPRCQPSPSKHDTEQHDGTFFVPMPQPIPLLLLPSVSPKLLGPGTLVDETRSIPIQFSWILSARCIDGLRLLRCRTLGTIY